MAWVQTGNIRGPQGEPGGAVLSGWWDYDPQTNPPVASGHIRTAPDPVVVGQPCTVYLASQDDDGLYWNVERIAPGDELRLRGSGGAVQHLIVTSFTETNPGVPEGYAIIEATLISSSAQIARNAKVEVALIREAPQGPPGPKGDTRIKHIGPTEPDTTGWAVDDLWFDTSTE